MCKELYSFITYTHYFIFHNYYLTKKNQKKEILLFDLVISPRDTSAEIWTITKETEKRLEAFEMLIENLLETKMTNVEVLQ